MLFLKPIQNHFKGYIRGRGNQQKHNGGVKLVQWTLVPLTAYPDMRKDVNAQTLSGMTHLIFSLSIAGGENYYAIIIFLMKIQL